MRRTLDPSLLTLVGILVSPLFEDNGTGDAWLCMNMQVNGEPARPMSQPAKGHLRGLVAALLGAAGLRSTEALHPGGSPVRGWGGLGWALRVGRFAPSPRACPWPWEVLVREGGPGDRTAGIPSGVGRLLAGVCGPPRCAPPVRVAAGGDGGAGLPGAGTLASLRCPAGLPVSTWWPRSGSRSSPPSCAALRSQGSLRQHGGCDRWLARTTPLPRCAESWFLSSLRSGPTPLPRFAESRRSSFCPPPGEAGKNRT
jgi:hypothetical protein